MINLDIVIVLYIMDLKTIINLFLISAKIMRQYSIRLIYSELFLCKGYHKTPQSGMGHFCWQLSLSRDDLWSIMMSQLYYMDPMVTHPHHKSACLKELGCSACECFEIRHGHYWYSHITGRKIPNAILSLDSGERKRIYEVRITDS